MASFRFPSIVSLGPIVNVGVALVSEGLRRWRLKYDDEECGRAGLVDEEEGVLEVCWSLDESMVVEEGVVLPEAMGDRCVGGV